MDIYRLAIILLPLRRSRFQEYRFEKGTGPGVNPCKMQAGTPLGRSIRISRTLLGIVPKTKIRRDFALLRCYYLRNSRKANSEGIRSKKIFVGAADRYSSGFWNKSIQNVGVQWFYIKLSCVLPLNAKLMDPKRMQRVAKEGAEPMSTREIVHTINNQLTIVMGRAALMAETAEDPGTRSRCKEIQSAVQTISRLINRMPQE